MLHHSLDASDLAFDAAEPVGQIPVFLLRTLLGFDAAAAFVFVHIIISLPAELYTPLGYIATYFSGLILAVRKNQLSVEKNLFIIKKL